MEKRRKFCRKRQHFYDNKDQERAKFWRRSKKIMIMTTSFECSLRLSFYLSLREVAMFILPSMVRKHSFDNKGPRNSEVWEMKKQDYGYDDEF